MVSGGDNADGFRNSAHRLRDLGKHVLRSRFAMRAAVGVVTVEREREDRDCFDAMALGDGAEIGFGGLADEQTRRFVDPPLGAPVAPAGNKVMQFAFPRLAAVELGLELERGTYAGDELRAIDRLGDVVGRAGDEGVGQAVGIVAGRHHDDGEIDVARIVTDSRAGLDAVHHRHGDIEQDKVEGGILVGGAPNVQGPKRSRSRICLVHLGVAGRQQRPFSQLQGILGIVDY